MSAHRILIMRHAKSDWSKPGQNDFDRALSGRGRRAAATMGHYLDNEGLVPDLVLCSAARRAVETWEIVSDAAGIEPRTEREEALYLADTQTLFERTRAVDDGVATLLFIGHAPGFDGFACRLAADRASPDWRRMAAKFPTGALAVLDLEGPSWNDVAEGSARLERFVAPKDLIQGPPSQP